LVWNNEIYLLIAVLVLVTINTAVCVSILVDTRRSLSLIADRIGYLHEEQQRLVVDQRQAVEGPDEGVQKRIRALEQEVLGLQEEHRKLEEGLNEALTALREVEWDKERIVEGLQAIQQVLAPREDATR
jgi:predicted nuclease with TOPRIM domain